MALPKLNTFFVNEEKIGLYWEASPKSNIKQWNIYGAPNVTVSFTAPNKGVVLDGGLVPENAFTLVYEGVKNRDTALTPGSCYVEFNKSDLGISSLDPFYFALTSVDRDDVESSIEIDKIHGVPFADDYFVDEAGSPVNVVYKNFEFEITPTSGWDVGRYIDVVSLLGRPAKQLKADAVGDTYYIKINSFNADPISVRNGIPYAEEFRRGEMQIYRIYLHNPTTTDIAGKILIAG